MHSAKYFTLCTFFFHFCGRAFVERSLFDNLLSLKVVAIDDYIQSICVWKEMRFYNDIILWIKVWFKTRSSDGHRASADCSCGGDLGRRSRRCLLVVHILEGLRGLHRSCCNLTDKSEKYPHGSTNTKFGPLGPLVLLWDKVKLTR